jgi:hypothetical protein
MFCLGSSALTLENLILKVENPPKINRVLACECLDEAIYPFQGLAIPGRIWSQDVGQPVYKYCV